MTAIDASVIRRALAEAIGFALLQWPLALLLCWLGTATKGQLALTALVAVSATVLQVSAWRRGGAGFGNALLCAQLGIFGACWLHPSAWALAPLAGAILLLLVAQYASLRRAGVPG